jgi:phosphoacetylglucosamine mutase
LKGLLKISNIVVGDSIANLLLIESILYDMNMSVQQFAEIYQENPSRLWKAKVNDRTKFKTIDDESRLTEPDALQDEIDKAVASVTDGKAFVRPSGTEDILRLYAEAKTEEEVQTLGDRILDVINNRFKDF